MPEYCRFLKLTDSGVIVSVDDVEFILPNKHTDERRTIYEKWIEGTGLLQVLHLSSLKESGPLGLHFHRYTRECFSIECGAGEVLLALVDVEGYQDGSIERRRLKVGDTIEVTPFTAHTFYLDPDSIMTCIASHKYDENDVGRTSWLVKS